MNLYDTVFEVIDMRSFSNLWYWIGLAVLWSSVSHWVIGVPYDTVIRARRGKTQDAMRDLHDLVRVNVNRILYIAEVSGTLIALIWSALLTMLGLAAFVYQVEFATAVFLLVAPMSILTLMTVRTAHLIRENEDRGEALIRRLLRHRIATQALGFLSIFVTAMYGMYTNLYVAPYSGF
ncbi:component of SufBCD complex [Silicimonas algicola]|uniref:Component of SufBCD complex n=1 Tax=Silicimonas algicola TaxID=1826607 RepID=A0A316GBG2_9RHOB|nr:component of SufBCD complex [Silicimonas algicola]AZQ67656.1 component of SufBCD complex [Silicimonas algicola]PWK57942.1 hypothetical protein C8D95_102592 [Silicimonas algicola]